MCCVATACRLVRTDIPEVRGQVPPTPPTFLSRVSQAAAAMMDQPSGDDRRRRSSHHLEALDAVALAPPLHSPCCGSLVVVGI